MNILTILNKLKEANMIPNTEDGLNLFSDCFNKFGISILLLKDEEKFENILDCLKENNIPLQKANGMFALRIFSVELPELKNIIEEYKEIDEIHFLRKYPEIISEAKTVHLIYENIKDLKAKNISYKNGDVYDIDKLLNEESESGMGE